MSQQKIVVEKVERLSTILSSLDLSSKIQGGLHQVFVNGILVSVSAIEDTVVGPEDLVVVLPVLRGG